jgi:hypothetical protein
MIYGLFTDEIKLVSVSQDKYGSITETESAAIKCKVEDDNRLVLDKDGKEAMSSILIFSPKGTQINLNDKIKVTKKNGVEYPEKDRKWQIKTLSLVGGFSRSHYEIRC